MKPIHNKASAEGFEAQGQNTDRENNPYIQKAKDWDDGWCYRKGLELRHRLEEDKIKELGSLKISFGTIIHDDA